MEQGEVIEGRYELVQRVGVGGMGAVWEALDRESGERVALKTLHDQYRENRAAIRRFTREAKAAIDARRSAHVVEVIELSSLSDGRPYMILEFLEGENLLEVIKREKMLAPDRSAGLIVQACEAVAEVHGQGIIHRDLKPGNLFVTRGPNGQEWIKLLDFGIAKFRKKPDDTTQSLTETGSALGTLRYMAPEQITDAKNVDHRSDVYSLGAILYRMLTGRAARDGKNIGQLIQTMGTHLPTSPHELRSEIDSALSQVVMRCIDVNPDKRFTSVTDLADALKPFCLTPLLDDVSGPDPFGATIPDGKPVQLPPPAGAARSPESPDELEATLEDTEKTTPIPPRVRQTKKPFVKTLSLFRKSDGGAPRAESYLPPQKVSGSTARATFQLEESPSESAPAGATTPDAETLQAAPDSADESTILVGRSQRSAPPVAWYQRTSVLVVFLVLIAALSATLTLLLVR